MEELQSLFFIILFNKTQTASDLICASFQLTVVDETKLSAKA